MRPALEPNSAKLDCRACRAGGNSLSLTLVLMGVAAVAQIRMLAKAPPIRLHANQEPIGLGSR